MEHCECRRTRFRWVAFWIYMLITGVLRLIQSGIEHHAWWAAVSAVVIVICGLALATEFID